jgi:hypothetical protein
LPQGVLQNGHLLFIKKLYHKLKKEVNVSKNDYSFKAYDRTVRHRYKEGTDNVLGVKLQEHTSSKTTINSNSNINSIPVYTDTNQYYDTQERFYAVDKLRMEELNKMIIADQKK